MDKAEIQGILLHIKMLKDKESMKVMLDCVSNLIQAEVMEMNTIKQQQRLVHRIAEPTKKDLKDSFFQKAFNIH